MNITKNKKGITLIALVITIVILIILATITINFLFGENGLIQRAEQSREIYTEGEEKETISLALAAIIAKLEPVERDNLQEEIDALRGAGVAEASEIGENLLQVRFTGSGNTYMVNKDGNIINTEVILDASYEFDPET